MLLACPSCQCQLNVPDHAAGKQARCPAPGCGSIFVAPPTLKPVAAPRLSTPPPVPATAFDFGGGPAGPEADFAFPKSADAGLTGIRLRTRRNRAAGWLNLAAGSMVAYVVFAFAVLVLGLLRAHGNEWISLAATGCTRLLLLPLAVVVAIGARLLSRARLWGLGLAAAVISLIMGIASMIVLLVVTVLFAVALVANTGAVGQPLTLLMTCGNLTLLACLAFFGTYGGIVSLRTLTNAEVKATFT